MKRLVKEEEEISLYRRLQRLGYYWPNMSREAADLQSQCSTCQLQHDNEEVYAIFASTDWRVPFLEYFLEGILPQTHKEVYRLKRLASRYFVEGRDFIPKRLPWRTTMVSQHIRVPNGHERGSRGFCEDMSHLPSSSRLDPHSPNQPPKHDNPMAIPHLGAGSNWPYWSGFPDGHIWILVATEYFTKWVEAVSLRKATGAAVANFIREHIITRFGIPYKLICDNGTPFVNKDVRELLEHYQVKHRRSTPYYPQGNGQAEATNRMLLRILSKMVFDYGSNWNSHLADVLWAYRSSPKTATGFTPFSLVYGTDTISPTELVVPTPRVLQGSDLEADANICAEARMADLEGLDESRELARLKSQRNYQKMANAYSKTLKVRIFAEGQVGFKSSRFCAEGTSFPIQILPKLGRAVPDSRSSWQWLLQAIQV
uniref:Integrase catalytic domain-containing protein n=1 Tax=Fagus sylvatica TaxID=28930 RepID=A0A2N9HTM4_FAGSY